MLLLPIDFPISLSVLLVAVAQKLRIDGIRSLLVFSFNRTANAFWPSEACLLAASSLTRFVANDCSVETVFSLSSVAML